MSRGRSRLPAEQGGLRGTWDHDLSDLSGRQPLDQLSHLSAPHPPKFEFLSSCFCPYLSHAALSRLYLNYSLISIFLRKVFTLLSNPGKVLWRNCSPALNLQVLNQECKSWSSLQSSYPWMHPNPHSRVTLKAGPFQLLFFQVH